MSNFKLKDFFESTVVDQPLPIGVNPVVVIAAANEARFTVRPWFGDNDGRDPAGTSCALAVLRELDADVDDMVTHGGEISSICANGSEKTDRVAVVSRTEVDAGVRSPQREKLALVEGIDGGAIAIQHIGDFFFHQPSLAGGAGCFFVDHSYRQFRGYEYE